MQLNLQGLEDLGGLAAGFFFRRGTNKTFKVLKP